MSQCLAESLSLGTGLPGGQGSGKGKPSEANGEVGRWGPQARPSSHFGCPLGKHDLAGPPCIGCLYKEGLKSVEKGWLTSSASKCGRKCNDSVIVAEVDYLVSRRICLQDNRTTNAQSLYSIEEFMD